MIRARHLRMAGRYLAHRFAAVQPYEVQALLLNACNLKCVYCRCPEMKTRVLTTAQWKGLLRQLGELGTLRIKFQGGEPTLRPDFAELAATARQAGMLTAVVTNGMAIAEHPELLEPLDEVVVSLDSVRPEIHDRLRGAGTHERAVAAIDLARGRGLPTYVVMVVSRASWEEVEPMLAFCEARGIRLHAQPVTFGRAYMDSTAEDLALSAEQVRTLHRRLAEWKARGRPLMFMAGTYRRTTAWPDYGQLTRRSAGPSPCMAGRFYVHIEPNGDVLPCQLHASPLEPKNAVRDGLVEALLHARSHTCGDCWSVYLNERKALFALSPRALLELARRG